MKVSDVMTRGVLTVAPDTTLHKTATLMLQYELSGFPVLEQGKLVGMISEGDLLRRAELGTELKRPHWIELFLGPSQLAEEYTHAHGRKVGDVMTRKVVSITEDTSLEEAVQLMEAHHVKRLPVLRNGGVIGMISRGNLLRAFVTATREPAAVKTSDATIRERLAAEFERMPWVPHGAVRTVVRHGVVRLEGVISDERERIALRVAAENVDGVKQVDDRLVEQEQSA